MNIKSKNNQNNNPYEKRTPVISYIMLKLSVINRGYSNFWNEYGIDFIE